MKRFMLLLTVAALLVWAHFARTQKMTIRDAEDNVLMEVNDEGTSGSITLGSAPAPAVTANKLYNVSGILYWNGDPLIPVQAGHDGDVLVTDGSSTAWAEHYVPAANFIGGNQMFRVLATPQVCRSVPIDCPAPGTIVVMVSGYARWETKKLDMFYGAIIDNALGYDATDFMNNMMSLSDYGCTDSSDQYMNWKTQRTYTISTPGTYRYDFWVYLPLAISKVRIDDANMSVMYFPEGSAIFSTSP